MGIVMLVLELSSLCMRRHLEAMELLMICLGLVHIVFVLGTVFTLVLLSWFSPSVEEVSKDSVWIQPSENSYTPDAKCNSQKMEERKSSHVTRETTITGTNQSKMQYKYSNQVKNHTVQDT